MPRGHVVPDGRTVAVLRGEAGLTQDELAARAGYALRTIGKIEGSRPTTSPTLAAVATVLSESLGRAVELGDLLVRGANPSASGTSDDEPLISEHVQWLDLSGRQHAADATARRRVVLTDTFSFTRVPAALAQLDFPYAALGRAPLGHSLSHPSASSWIAAPADSANSGGTLRLKLGDELRSMPLVVRHRLEYWDDLAWHQRPCFQTRVCFATNCLTLVVLFPAERPAGRLRGWLQASAGEALIRAKQQPLELFEGRIGFWRIESPKPGEIYQLRAAS